MIKRNTILLTLLLLFIWSCQEVYEPEGINADKKIVVINGLYTDTDSSIEVTVFNAEVFGNNSFEAISDALVWLKDENGNSYQFSKSKAGHYTLKTEQLLQTDTSRYFVHVETSDGAIFESDPQGFPGKVDDIEINAEIGTQEYISKNDAGEVTSAIDQGLILDISLKSSDRQKRYLRFADTAVYQNINSFFTPPIDEKCVSFHPLSTVPVVEATLDDGEDHIVNNKEIGFLRYIYNSDYQNENSTARVTDTWVLLSKVYSMSKEGYNYYQKILNQVSAQDKLFDPNPTQIYGNITCVSDPSVLVLGYFEVSRMKQTIIAFGWSPDDTEFNRKDLNDYNRPYESGCTVEEPDYDWITFE